MITACPSKAKREATETSKPLKNSVMEERNEMERKESTREGTTKDEVPEGHREPSSQAATRAE